MRIRLPFVWSILLLLAACLSTARAQAPKTTPPNVVFIAIDDLNDWVGAYKVRPDVQTPNIDKLAKKGVMFTRAYCAAPSCNPSRTAILTGVRPSTSGVYENNNPWRPVMPNVVTLQQYFMAHGYDVEGGGKIFHEAYDDPKSWGLRLPVPPSPLYAGKNANGLKMAHFDWAPINVADKDMGDYKVVDWSLERWNAKRDKPLFLAVGMTRPHLPWYVPKAYFDRYPLESVKRPETRDDDLNDVPTAGVRMAKPNGDHKKVTDTNQWEKAVQGYLASITFMDAQIGRLLDGLEKSGKLSNTIIVLWGDHGWNLGEKKHWRKFALWEDTTRVPFIVYAPGKTPAGGAVCDRVVNLMDLYPTLVEFCGLPKKDGVEARSIVPLLTNPKQPWDHPTVTTYLFGNHAVRSERWRYIRYENGDEELYDHDADPREYKNLASDPKYAVIKRDLANHLPKTNAPTAPIKRGGGGD